MASTGEARRLGRLPDATLLGSFDPRANSIGFLRLAFAITVVVAHAFPLGGYAPYIGRPDNNIGELAVDGFFVLSGFLITRSGETASSVPRFVWHRFLRIMPGFWTALVVSAFVVAPLAVLLEHGRMGTWWTASDGWYYVTRNLNLRIGDDAGVGDALRTVPYAWVIDGPLYTLEYEFACYLFIAALVALRVLRPSVLLLTALGAWAVLQGHALGWVSLAHGDRQLRFFFMFLLGSGLYLLRGRVPMSSLSAALAGLVAVGTYGFGGWVTLGLPAFGYLCLWAAVVIPFRRVGVKRDFSYGVYLYGWPVAQLLAVVGVHRLGFSVFLALTLAGVAPLAAASWYLVERPAMTLRGWVPRHYSVATGARRTGSQTAMQ